MWQFIDPIINQLTSKKIFKIISDENKMQPHFG